MDENKHVCNDLQDLATFCFSKKDFLDSLGYGFVPCTPLFHLAFTVFKPGSIIDIACTKSLYIRTVIKPLWNICFTFIKLFFNIKGFSFCLSVAHTIFSGQYNHSNLIRGGRGKSKLIPYKFNGYILSSLNLDNIGGSSDIFAMCS